MKYAIVDSEFMQMDISIERILTECQCIQHTHLQFADFYTQMYIKIKRSRN